MKRDRPIISPALYPGSERARAVPDTARANQHPRFSIFACVEKGLFTDFQVPTEAMILPEPDLEKALNLTMKCNFQWRWNVHEEESLMLNYTLSFLFIYWGAGGSEVRKEPGGLRKPGAMFTRPGDKSKYGTKSKRF